MDRVRRHRGTTDSGSGVITQTAPPRNHAAMKRTITSLGLLLVVGGAFEAAPAASQVATRIWVESAPEYFRRGDRIDVNFSVSDDSYVAVIHIDTDGNLDFLYPTSPWDNEFVRGGMIHSVLARGGGGGWLIRGRPGIGYFYIIASPTPLDFSYFRGRAGSPWEWGYAGRVVHGDPFLALDQLARLLLPRTPYARYAYDFYSYYVDGLHQYPSYACSNQYYEYGWGMSPSFGSCVGQTLFLRQNPYYYDTRRYRGDRRQVLGGYGTIDPRYGYKTSPDTPLPGVAPGGSRPSLQGSGGQIPRREPEAVSTPRPSSNAERPALGRAPAQGRTGQARTAQPAESGRSSSTGVRERPTPDAGSRPATTSGPSGRSASPSGVTAPARRRPTID